MLETEACFRGAGDPFWTFLSLTRPAAISGEDDAHTLPLSLGACAALSEQPGTGFKTVLNLQLNFWNAWMDKFRSAGPEALLSLP